MILKLDLERLQTPEEVCEFMAGNALVDFQLTSRSDAYDGIRRLLVRLHYLSALRQSREYRRAAQTPPRQFLRQTGKIKDRRCGPGKPFRRRYTAADIRLLAELDETLGWPCSARARRFMQRQYEVLSTWLGRAMWWRIYVKRLRKLQAVESISERFMVPTLRGLIAAFPFVINGFHADNGSEYINRQVAKLLHNLHIKEFTKSRPRHSNDNALVESKNASVVRHYLGHSHIPRHHAALVNDFLKDLLAPFVNYHRPCQFPVDKTDEKGRVRKVYRYENVTTPYQKLKSLPQAEQFLRDGVTFEQLDRLALATDSFSMAKTVNETRDELFREIARRDQSVA